MKYKYKILLVDDEKDILEFLSYNLKKEGFIVFTANNGTKGLELSQEHKPDLIILDVMMPEMDGVTVCQNIREIKALNETLILFLTARSEEYSELAGFAAGADDYITKPIKPKLLISRINAILKRTRSTKEDHQIQIGNINIDKEKHILTYNNEELHLARKEFHLLYYLMSIPGKVFTRQDIIDNIWKDALVGDRTIDVHIRKIREKIGSHHIKTIKGVGYKFDI
ncbi:MAG: DNA-binding response regulator [Flavobacteriales bacterium]|nr:DNA-binding response regulator [Flavobacteriales bacterium]|tara:strand:+ start:126 stop:800 length:675 start_codon:yes stop_codon:yes gene_type:complete